MSPQSIPVLMWPAVMAAGVSLDLWLHQPLIASLGVGIGATAAAVFAGLGMRTMHFRASSIGGRLVISTRSEGGVCIACEVAQPPIAVSA